ncbi:facilitated trehalose transporter Tret1-2 homolog [Drosophila tropicalis]|uniref:facilitated trehalose transporter Tret1-2 homolog n=1 Tax=Drosophila tropicalis TaxID=46794 RepID=UPI0035ABE446
MLPPAWKQYIAGLSAAFGATGFGSAGGWSAPLEGSYKDGSSGYPFQPNDDEWGWISSLLSLGAAFMSIPTGLLVSYCGRKTTMLSIAIPFVIGWSVIGFAQNVYMMYGGRFILGACGGSYGVAAPIYTTEVAQITKRGRMGCFFHLMIVHGVLYSFICGAFLPVKVVNLMCGMLPVVFFTIFIWMPESPVYLMQKGKVERAEKALRFLRGKDADVTAELAKLTEDAKKKKERFRFTKTILKEFFISITLMFYQQFSGINAIVFYSTQIFESANADISPNICTILLGIIMVMSTVVAISLIDRVGRRIILLISSSVMCFSSLVMACYFHWLQSKNMGWLPVLAILLFIISFSLGFGPVPFLLMAELFAEDVKPVAGSIACSCCWFFAFCVIKLFPLGVKTFGEACVFAVFGASSLSAYLFVLVFVPETKGKTLNEIQAMLGG